MRWRAGPLVGALLAVLPVPIPSPHALAESVLPATGTTTPDSGETNGWVAYNAGHYVEAVRLWTAKAPSGDLDAQFGLGIAYDLGQGVAADSQTSCIWYERAGAGGHVAAAFNAASMHDTGRCGPRRADQAALWYARAAAAGHPRAQFDLAQLYATGDGVPVNPDLAAAWFRVAAANGIAAANGRREPSRPTDPTQPLRGVIPVVTADAPVPVGGTTVLVWLVPPQPQRVHFLVEVAAIGPSGTHEVLARWVDVSALQIKLPAADQAFVWRVITVGIDPARYVAMPWQRLPMRS